MLSEQTAQRLARLRAAEEQGQIVTVSDLISALLGDRPEPFTVPDAPDNTNDPGAASGDVVAEGR